MATQGFHALDFTGGGATALDAIPESTITASIAVAFVFNSNKAYWYVWDSSSTDTESSPDVITPDDSSGSGRWILQGSPYDTGISSLPSGVSLSGFSYGFKVDNNTTDPDHDLDFAAGVCFDSTNTVVGSNSSSMTKRADANWVVGDAEGMMQSGSTIAASTWYHIWRIIKDSDGSIDFLMVPQGTSVSLPSGYTKSRYMITVVTDASANIVQFLHIQHLNIVCFKSWTIAATGLSYGYQSVTLPFDTENISSVCVGYGRSPSPSTKANAFFAYTDSTYSWKIHTGINEYDTTEFVYGVDPSDLCPILNGTTVYVNLEKDAYSNYATAQFGIKALQLKG